MTENVNNNVNKRNRNRTRNLRTKTTTIDILKQDRMLVISEENKIILVKTS